MTQAFNLSQLANNLDSSGRLDATDGLVNAIPVANGGTGASTAAAARANLSTPSSTGSGASGTWGIDISGNAATATNATNATNATYATTSGNGGVISVDGLTGNVLLQNLSSFSKNLSSSGYQYLPGGLIMQWKSCGRGTTSLPITFPNSVLGWSFCVTTGDEGPFSTNELVITVNNSSVVYTANRVNAFKIIVFGF